MNYSETIKKSEVKQVPGGYEKKLSCKKVLDVRNESEEMLKFSYNANEEVLTILEGNFKLLTVTYLG